MAALLEAKGLEKAFGSVVAASNVNVAVNEHEVVGMIGSNGAGKTTFVNMVTGYVKPSAGQILYQGRDITSLIPRAVTRIGITRSFQIPQVFLTASVQDNLLISLGVAERKLLEVWRPLRRADLAQVAFDMLKRYGIDEYSDQTAQLLPQGVRKLLDIAMAVVHGPKVLLLDEPTSGVAIEEKFGIMDTVMNALREQKVTVLFVEHDMEIVQRYATRVLAFYDGTIIADGAPDHVLSDAKVRQYVIGEELHRKGAQEGGHA